MDDGLLSLKWNNHKTTFFDILKNLREKSNYTDATLAVEGKFYPVHKLVMSTCSEYFSDIFERTPCKSPVIVLKDVRNHDIEALLDYMYIGEVNVNQNDLASLLKTAECLRIKGLAVPDEDPTKVRKNSTSSLDDTHRESPPPKRRRHDSNPLPPPPPRVVSPVPSPQKPATTTLVNPAQTPSIPKHSSLPTHSTSNTLPRTEQEEPPVVKVEMDDEDDQEDRFRRENNFDGGASSEKDPSGDFDLSKTEHDLENYSNASFAGPSLQQGVESHWDEGDSSSFPPESYSGDVPTSQQAQGGRGLMYLSDHSTLKLLPPISAQNHLENFQINHYSTRNISSHVNQTGENLKDQIGQFSSENMMINSENENTGLAFQISPDFHKKRLVDNRHQCFLCGKIFQFSNDLRKHVRTHTGEKPYGCPYCSYRATQKVHLRGHILRKHLPIQNLEKNDESGSSRSKF